MPPATKIKDFIQAVQERKSEIAKKLDISSSKCSDVNYRAALHDLINNWTPGSTDPEDPLYKELKLTPKEVKHINAWGNGVLNSLELLKTAALTATHPTAPRAMQFFWEIVFDGPEDSIQTIVDVAQSPFIVTFYTHRKKVKKGSLLTKGEIDVEV